MKSTVMFLAYLSIATTVLVAITALLTRNCAHDNGCRVFRYYFVLAAIADLVLLVFHSKGWNNMQVFNIFSLTQYFLVFLALSQWIPQGMRRTLLYIFLGLSTLFFGSYLFTIFNLKYMDTFSSSIEYIILTLLSAYVLFHLTDDQSDYLYRNFKFWFTVGVFLYFSVTSIVLATANYVLKDSGMLQDYTWAINGFLTILASVMYIKGFLCLKRSRT